MARPDLLVVFDVLSSAAGFLVSILMWVLLRGSARRWPGTTLLLACSLLWNTGSLAALLQMLAGIPTTAWTHLLAVCLQAFGGALFPVSFIAAWPLPDNAEPWRERLRVWLYRASVTNAAAVPVIILFHAVAGFFPHAKIVLPLTTALLLTAASIGLVADRLTTTIDRVYLSLTLLGTWLAAAGIMALEFAPLTGTSFRTTCLIVTEAPCMIIAGALLFYARFRSADVLIKSSLRVVAAMLIAFAGFAATLYSPTFYSIFVGRALWVTLAFFTLVLGFRWIDNLLIYAAERWILRQPDYAAALCSLRTELAGLDSQADIFAAVERELPAFLEVTAVQVIDTPKAGTPAPRFCPISGGELDGLTPIRLRGENPYSIAVAPGQCRRILLNKDLHFLQETAGLISVRLEALTLERERVERQSREANLKHLAAVAELKALRAQINPHFLFNSLNTIADLIVADPAKAETMTVLLASVFRHVLLHSDRHLTAISEEVEFLRTYLRIEEVRFGERLQVNVDIQPSVAATRIPSLLLQPIVENAIKHGLAPKVGPGKLRIAARTEGDFTKLEIEDDGVGIDTTSQRPGGGGVGLKNVAERLRMLYNGRASMTCENTATTTGTLVTILIPNGAQA